jgi:hypothetical protein
VKVRGGGRTSCTFIGVKEGMGWRRNCTFIEAKDRRGRGTLMANVKKAAVCNEQHLLPRMLPCDVLQTYSRTPHL